MLHRFIKVITPQNCINCNKFGTLLCDPCSELSTVEIPVCYRCNRLSKGFKTCRTCRGSSQVYSVVPVSEYGGLAKALVYAMKFGNTREAAEIISLLIKPHFNEDFDAITYPPTDSARIRMRGYDHARLMAMCISQYTQAPIFQPLVRIGSVRQVGASRETRRAQMKSAFRVRTKKGKKVPRTVLLVDDVISTGATLEAVAANLKLAGVKRVHVVVFARNRIT